MISANEKQNLDDSKQNEITVHYREGYIETKYEHASQSN